MKSFFDAFIKLIILICVLIGGSLIYKEGNDRIEFQETSTNKKALALKKYLIKFQKPTRVEINNLTKRLNSDVQEIKKLTISLDKNSHFYISIDLFTDEHDKDAPLIAQIKFFDLRSNNKIKEENINLD